MIPPPHDKNTRNGAVMAATKKSHSTYNVRSIYRDDDDETRKAAVDLARCAETALVRGLYRDAADSANRCLVLPRAERTQHSSSRAMIMQEPFRWNTLQSLRYGSIQLDDEDDTDDPWERCAAVAWQSWYAAVSHSVPSSSVATTSTTLLTPFWRLYTTARPNQQAQRPLRIPLLVLILQLCWATDKTRSDRQWIAAMATEVLCKYHGRAKCDALGVVLLTEWLPRQSLATTRATLARLTNEFDDTGEERTCPVEALLAFCTSTNLPWAVRCRDCLVSKLRAVEKKTRQQPIARASWSQQDSSPAVRGARESSQQLLIPTSSLSSTWRRCSSVVHRRIAQWIQCNYTANAVVSTRMRLPAVVLGTVVLLLWLGRTRRVLGRALLASTTLTELMDAIVPRRRPQPQQKGGRNRMQ